MDAMKSLDEIVRSIAASGMSDTPQMKRLLAELKFARQFAELVPDREGEWKPLILKAAGSVRDALAAGSAVEIGRVAADAEQIMSPIGKAAKEYTFHCCGHAHIDMNWMWPWQETVSVSHDTFATVDRLMDEFPEFHFSQSQASTYIGMEEYCPEIFEMIKKRIAEGRWEPTASTWVEGSKNLASGEILCRHLLYTRRYLKERFGLPYDVVKIDWSPDTFGHAHTLPTILSRGGVTRYYHCRTGPNNWLTWWQGPDGSRVMLFLDKVWYNGVMDLEIMTNGFIDYVKETGLKDYLYLYGVGDHGGGPTRRDLAKALEMAGWPIYPNVRLSTTDAYFTAVEAANPDLPVHDGELNYVFRGCYTSQSNIKHANRVSENILPEVEAISVVAGAAAGFPYPMEQLRKGWRMAMFSQFHDILPGSGIHATYEYAQGLFQEIQAIAGSVRTRALRGLAARIDTSAASGIEPPSGNLGASIGNGIGAGAGDPGIPGGVTARNMGAVSAEPVVVFNQMAFPRSEMVYAKVWNKDFPANHISVRDDMGNLVAGQVINKGNYWGHDYFTVVFPTTGVPALGYRTYTIDRTAKPTLPERVEVPRVIPLMNGYLQEEPIDFPAPAREVTMPKPNVLENDFVRVEVDTASGAIKHLVDKSTGYDMVPEGELMGVLELHQEAPHGMTSWEIGQVQSVTRLTSDGFIVNKAAGYEIPAQCGLDVFPVNDYVKNGPHRASITIGRKLNNSHIFVEIGLNSDSPTVDFNIKMDWREIGTRTTGVPMLKIAFTLRIDDPTATYEIPFGSIRRPVGSGEVPALKWADLSGNRVGSQGSCGITLLNSDKYGYNAEENTISLTLVRSSYDPDPIPEVGEHNTRLAIVPHNGFCPVSQATKAAAAFGLPMNVVSTDIHQGDLPGSMGFVEVFSPNVMLASMKKAEDSDAVVLRMYEMEGKDTEACIRISNIVPADASATEVDLMEQPLPTSTARMDGDTLSVRIPAHGLATVKVG